MDRMLPQAMPETRDLIETARTIFAIATNRNEPLTVTNLAMKSGLTEGAVLAVLNNHRFFEAMLSEFRATTNLAVWRGLGRMQEIVDKGADRESIAAFRAIIETYKVSLLDPGAEADEDETLKSLMERARKMRDVGSAKDAEFKLRGKKHASRRRKPHPQDPPEAREDEGRDHHRADGPAPDGREDHVGW